MSNNIQKELYTNPKRLFNDIVKVAKMHGEGKTVEEIAAAINRPTQVVQQWITKAIVPAMKMQQIKNK